MTDGKTPLVLTAIVNYRTPDLTLRAVDAALRAMQDIPGGIVVVDNDSGDGSYKNLVREAEARGWTEGGRVQVISSPRNGGFGAGNNLAIRTGLPDGKKPDYVYILNSDAFPAPDALRALIRRLGRSTWAGLAGSYIHGPKGDAHITAFRFPSIASEFEGAACTGIISRLLNRSIVPMPIPRQTQPVDWLAGASLLIRREVLDEVGLFDEGYFLYFEETDLCRRAARHGWATLYVRESAVTHIGSVSTGMKTWRRTPGYWYDSRLRYFVRNHGPAYAALATLAHVAGGALLRLRCLVSDKRSADPPRFLRDLIRHDLRAAMRAIAPRRARLRKPAAGPAQHAPGGQR